MIDEEKQISGIIPGLRTPANWDHSIRPSWIDLALNFNAIPYKSDTAIIVTSWHGHLPWLKATLKNYRLTDKYVICAYDFPFEAWGTDDLSKMLPAKDIWLLSHSWVFKHPTFDTNKREGWFWDVKYALGIINQFNFKYVFTVNSDCIWEKPEGVDVMLSDFKNMGGDLVSVSSEDNCIHTCAILWKVEALNKAFDYMTERYSVPVIGSFSPEVVLLDAVKHIPLIETRMPKQPMDPNGSVDHYCRYNQDSSWKDYVGFRNLGSEHLTCCVERKEPIPPEYVDLRYSWYFGSTGASSLVKYYETGDKRWLYKHWDENEDSYYDRLYYSLECYGK